MGYLSRKKYHILEVFKRTKSGYLEGPILLSELEKRGVKMTKRQLSLFIYNNMELEYLKADRDSDGRILGWNLIKWA
ncbi:MAG: hypothetical protein ACE5HY_05455 [Candidatus Hydrothermarchaeales archaeon]